MRSSVDFPEPLRPTRQMRSPAATARAAPESSGAAPKVRPMSCSRSSGGGISARVARLQKLKRRLIQGAAAPPIEGLVEDAGGIGRRERE